MNIFLTQHPAGSHGEGEVDLVVPRREARGAPRSLATMSGARRGGTRGGSERRERRRSIVATQERTRSASGRGIDEARLSCLHLEVGTCSWCLGCSRRVAE